MIGTLMEPFEMAKEETMSVKISINALEKVRIASAIRGESQANYASRVLLEAAERDIEEFKRGVPVNPAAPKKPKGGKA